MVRVTVELPSVLDDLKFEDVVAASEFEPGDAASVGFHIPRLAVEKKDMYYSADFTQGLTLETVVVGRSHGGDGRRWAPGAVDHGSG